MITPKTIFIFILLVTASILVNAQNICKTCDTLPQKSAMHKNIKLCFKTDSIDHGTEFKIEHQHKCQNYKEIFFVKKDKKYPYVAMEITNQDTIYTTLDTAASFPNGGQSALMKYLAANLRYPSEERENRIQGKVFVSFVITATGEITDIEILRGVSPGIDNETKRIITTLPKWESAVYKGRKVKNKFVMPLSFRIN